MGKGELFSLASAFCWAISVILFKRSGEQMRPFALNLVKNVLALALMIPTLWLFSSALPALPAGTLSVVLISGVLGIALADTLYFEALNRLGASRMGIVGSLFSPFVVLLSLMFLGERLSLLQSGGFALVLAGVMLATITAPATDLSRHQLVQGLSIGAVAVLTMALGIVMVKRPLEQYEFLWIVQLRLIGGVIGLLFVMVLRRRSKQLLAELREPHHWPRIIIASILGSYISLMLWMAGYKYTLASIASVLNETASLFIVLLAWLMLGEPLTKRKLAGVLLSFCGVCLLLPETASYLRAVFAR